MAQRAQPKTKRKTVRKPPVNDLATATARLEGEAKTLRSERDALREELAAAKARIVELEAAQTEAINRIDWVIDSLHTAMEDGD